jgi:hypothetical protein
MQMPIVAMLCALTAAIGPFAAWTQPPGDLPLVFTGAIRPLQPPAGAGAWQLQVITRGGLGGSGTGDFAISSAGSMTVFTPETTVAVRADVLGRLREYVSTSTPAQWNTKPGASLCSDCVSTLVVLMVRTPAGGVQTYTAVWDPTMKARVPPDALRIHDLALSVRQAIGR